MRFIRNLANLFHRDGIQADDFQYLAEQHRIILAEGKGQLRLVGVVGLVAFGQFRRLGFVRCFT